MATRFRTKSLRLLHRINRSKAIWLRALLSLLIGITLLFIADKSHYDPRFQIRGSQEVSQRIVLLSISPTDWENMGKEIEIKNPNLSRWEPKIWNHILETLQKSHPYQIGVTLSFTGDPANLDPIELKNDANVYWSSSKQGDKVIPPYFLNQTNKNFGASYFYRDSDEITRRHYFPKNEMTFLENMTQSKIIIGNENQLINFRGKKGQFKRIPLVEIFKKDFPNELLENKYILIGHTENNDQVFLTPTGYMSKMELLANVLDNIIEQRWIHRLPQSLSIAYLIALLMAAIWLMSTYPHTIGLALLFWLGTMTTGISVWVFDSFYFWIPILAPLCLLTITYIIFLSLQLTRKENTNWRLEQERKMQAESEKLKNNFVSLISHDLKTPITKIQAICDRLLSKIPSPPQYIKDIKSLRHESTELHSYIQSILRVSQIESQDFQIHKEATDINKIIRNVILQLNPMAKEKNIIIEKDLEPMFLVELDSVLIQEVLLNIIENAIKYSEKDGHICVKIQEQENQVEIQITDQGQGISEADQKKIFDKFYRSPQQTTRTKGTGLGLYMVKYFIELHNGKVSLNSQLGKGTQVQIHLPIS